MSFKFRFRWRSWMRKNTPIVVIEDVETDRFSISHELVKAYYSPIVVSFADNVVDQLAAKKHDLIIYEPYPPDKFSAKMDDGYLIFFEDDRNQDTVFFMTNTVYSETPLIITLPEGRYSLQGIKTFTVDQLKASYDEMFGRVYKHKHEDK